MMERGIGDIIDAGLTSPFNKDISEFAHKLMQIVLGEIYTSLYDSVQKSMKDLFYVLNYEVTKAATRINGGVQAWNEDAFNLIKNIAENVCIPIAASFITVIFCWELIHLIQESNSMNNVKPEKIMIVLLKFGLCLLVCAKSFDIIIGISDLGAWASEQLGLLTSSELRSFDVDLSEMTGLVRQPPEYDIGMLMTLCGYKIVLFIGKIGIIICGAIVYIRVMIWFIEFLIYASAAPIPYSTWVNKEWAQVGMNYTRKMLALAFEGFFMLLLFAIYGGVISGISSGDFMQNMVMVIGCGFALCVMMFKTGNISASIFNAH